MYPRINKHPGLFVSFKKKNNKWTKAYDLNFGEATGMAYVSPDMKYLFYKFNGDIYWVDAKIIEQLKPDELKKKEML